MVSGSPPPQVGDSLRASLQEARSAALAAREARRDAELERDAVQGDLEACRGAVEGERRRTDAMRQAMAKAEQVAASVTADLQESCDTARQSATDARAKLAAAQERCAVGVPCAVVPPKGCPNSAPSPVAFAGATRWTRSATRHKKRRMSRTSGSHHCKRSSSRPGALHARLHRSCEV